MGQGFRRATRAFALFAVATACAVPTALAGDSGDTAAEIGIAPATEVGALRSEGSGKWLVELSGSAADFRSQAKAAGLKYTERFSFSQFWNGVSVAISASQLDRLEGLPSVAALYPVYPATVQPMTGGEQLDLATAVQTTGAKAANTAGYTGAGVRVAVMDTGVDYDHPDLGNGCFGNSSCKVAKGYDFVGDDYDAGTNPVTHPDRYPDDCNGHGTHVAGIVAANGVVKGVAPAAKIHAYRVFGCEGSTDSDIMIAAMIKAFLDGSDVLNMSIGSSFMTWPQYPTAKVASILVDLGMVVVASIGNSGANGQFSAGAPGVGNNVIGVGSFDNTVVTQFAFRVSPTNQLYGYSGATGSPSAPRTGSLPLTRTGTSASTADACPTAPDLVATLPPLTGKAVLIRRGTCGFYNKALAAQNAGAAAVILYNNVAGTINPTVAPVAPLTTPITIPVVAASGGNGNAIDAAIAANPATAAITWTSETATETSPTGNRLSAFSSYGQNAELTLKPDISAPGGDIFSTYPVEKGSYNSIGGTSMSSPHVAGAAALLRQARPTLRASKFRDVLQNSADPKNWSGNPALGFLDYSFRQGAGMLDIDDSINATSVISPGKLSLGESEAGPQTRSLTITNNGSAAATYAFGNVNTLAASGTATPAPGATNPPFSFGIFTHAALVTFSAPTVTIPAGGSASVAVTISPSATLPDRSQYGGYITVDSGDSHYSVPYAGLKGDYQSIQHIRFGLTGRAFPDGSLQVLPAGGSTFTLVGDDVPNVMLNLGHQPRRVELSVVHAATGAPVHAQFSNFHEEDYVGRSSASNTVLVWPWNGTRLQSNGNRDKRKTVPDGTYKMVAKVLKALGNPANPADWESYTSDAVTIDRP
jgi:minor extracellular serine protease Vpr